jgi:2-polyprenyl-3-methyl-5-hydroxy-6-metoxy-1,4-benzoquinol methylase
MHYYTAKEKKYFSNIRQDMIAYLPAKKDINFLDIGCSGGDTICFLKSKFLIKKGTGVELFDLPDSNQSNPLIDKMIIGDIQEKNLELPHGSFDVIFCGDVLEHLHDPWGVMEYLKNFLKPDGILIVSIPNIREIRTMYKIFIRGDFKYEQSGILDKTHLRFFCKKNIQQLFIDTGYEILTVNPTFKTCPLQPSRRRINQLTLNLFNEVLAQQFIVTARKKVT